MNKMSNTELKVLVNAAFNKSVRSGKVNPIQHRVMVRVSNALKIEESIAALNSAEGK